MYWNLGTLLHAAKAIIIGELSVWRAESSKSFTLSPYIVMCISIRLGKYVKKEHLEKNVLSVLLNLIFSSINSLLFSNVWPRTNTCSNNWIALSLPRTSK